MELKRLFSPISMLIRRNGRGSKHWRSRYLRAAAGRTSTKPYYCPLTPQAPTLKSRRHCTGQNFCLSTEKNNQEAWLKIMVFSRMHGPIYFTIRFVSRSVGTSVIFVEFWLVSHPCLCACSTARNFQVNLRFSGESQKNKKPLSAKIG